jgi:ribosomal protein L3
VIPLVAIVIVVWFLALLNWIREMRSQPSVFGQPGHAERNVLDAKRVEPFLGHLRERPAAFALNIEKQKRLKPNTAQEIVEEIKRRVAEGERAVEPGSEHRSYFILDRPDSVGRTKGRGYPGGSKRYGHKRHRTSKRLH